MVLWFRRPALWQRNVGKMNYNAARRYGCSSCFVWHVQKWGLPFPLTVWCFTHKGWWIPQILLMLISALDFLSSLKKKKSLHMFDIWFRFLPNNTDAYFAQSCLFSVYRQIVRLMINIMMSSIHMVHIWQWWQYSSSYVSWTWETGTCW